MAANKHSEGIDLEALFVERLATFEDAVRDSAFRGTQPPCMHEGIHARLELAREQVLQMFRDHYEPRP